MMEPGQMSKVKQRIQLQNHSKKHRLLDYIRNSVLFHITTLKNSLFWLDLLDLFQVCPNENSRCQTHMVHLWSNLLWLWFQRLFGSAETEREAALLPAMYLKMNLSGLSDLKSSKCSPEPTYTHVLQLVLFVCVRVCVHAVGGLFLSLQCSLPAGGDDDRSLFSALSLVDDRIKQS